MKTPLADLEQELAELLKATRRTFDEELAELVKLAGENPDATGTNSEELELVTTDGTCYAGQM